ncbi:phosphomannomutase [Panacagrimonas perspica]|uniref:phosphomannomutase n=1 Tax=Panacagrimonas perspica TaxID=381431 RepID=A0A4S3K0E2_9GAMM|nr:phosphomannomutase [Panacagrimonas perspica]TDU23218.1 phosphomannomutase [Panacagrimonas perspica]THD01377.1 phosphomannomutase [Panacagrimonas perspica]
MTSPAPKLNCFKAYDIRGRVPDELNPEIAYRLGLAFAEHFSPRCVALGHDVRHSSRPLLEAIAVGLNERGVEVLDLGLCGTEEVYWAAQQPGVYGAIEVTASHNPIDYNGMKLVLADAVPVSGDSGLREIEAIVSASTAPLPATPARMVPTSYRASYVEHLLTYLDTAALRPMSVVINAGNGAAGPLLDALEPRLPFRLIKLHHAPDGSFPNGIPNPLIPQMRLSTSAAVRASGADFGVAWDGDFDRCFLFDERGEFIEGYYVVGLLAEALLAAHVRRPGEGRPRVIHDPRLIWNTIDVVLKAGGQPVQSKTGHAFIKERMRSENAVYGGEMSAHHYFRGFAYCDNGMLPWLLVAAMISRGGKPLSQLVRDRVAQYPVSGEINRGVPNVSSTLKRIEERYAAKAISSDDTDGLSLDFGEWRFNLRGSNTEPLLRLNVEARGDHRLMNLKTAELLAAVDAES